MLLGCSTKKPTSFKLIQHNAPSDGVVSLNIMKDTALQVLTDGIGMRYYELIYAENRKLIRAKYQINTPEGTMDGGRTEEFLFYWPEINNNQITWEGNDFLDLQPKFMRACFCRGEAGLFDVDRGKLILDPEKRTFEVHFDIESGSQFFSSFKATY